MNTRDTSFSTTRLDLSLLAMADFEDVYQYGRDPEVSRHTSWPTHLSTKDAQDYVSFVVASESDLPGSLRHTWAIRFHQDAKVIGTIDLVQENDLQAHTDYVLARSCWNRGFMTEAVQAVASWGFNRLHALERIRSGCLTANVGSWRVLEKSGFRLVSRRRTKFGAKFDHQELEVCHYELSRRDWVTTGHRRTDSTAG